MPWKKFTFIQKFSIFSLWKVHSTLWMDEPSIRCASIRCGEENFKPIFHSKPCWMKHGPFRIKPNKPRTKTLLQNPQSPSNTIFEHNVVRMFKNSGNISSRYILAWKMIPEARDLIFIFCLSLLFSLNISSPQLVRGKKCLLTSYISAVTNSSVWKKKWKEMMGWKLFSQTLTYSAVSVRNDNRSELELHSSIHMF